MARSRLGVEALEHRFAPTALASPLLNPQPLPPGGAVPASFYPPNPSILAGRF